MRRCSRPWRALANWFPAGQLGVSERGLSVGLVLGQAATGPLVTLLIVTFGWRASFYVLAPLGRRRCVVVLVRPRPACGTPRDHRRGARLIKGDRPPASRRRASAALATHAVQRDVLLLAASYFCMNYVFYMFAHWLFTYLVEARGFSLLESGSVVLPFATGAALAGPRRAHLRCAVPTDRRAGAAACRRWRGWCWWPFLLLAGVTRRTRTLQCDAVALLRVHPVHRGLVLVGDHLCCRPPYCIGHGRASTPAATCRLLAPVVG